MGLGLLLATGAEARVLEEEQGQTYKQVAPQEVEPDKKVKEELKSIIYFMLDNEESIWPYA